MACSINVGVVVGFVMIYLSQSWETRPLLEMKRASLVKSVVRFNESSTVTSEGLMLSASTVAKLCGLRQSCYFIVGVFGVSTGFEPKPSTFTLMYSSSDDITDLINLVPITSHCALNKPQFYRYVLTQPSVVC